MILSQAGGGSLDLPKSRIQFKLCRTLRRDDAKGPLAQSVEHLTLNQGVVGSIPTRPIFVFSGSGALSTGRRENFDDSRQV